MHQGINDLCLKMPAILGRRRMPNGSEMFAPADFIMVKSGYEAELTKANEQIRSLTGETGFRVRSGADQSSWFQNNKKRRFIMLYTILGILLVLWLLGFSMHVGGGLIHALLVIAVVVFLVNFFSGRRSMA